MQLHNFPQLLQHLLEEYPMPITNFPLVLYLIFSTALLIKHPKQVSFY
nr:MAG TPA: hypothetical protein [Caudoviricetes sp.]